jgi:hypothetical protein
MIKKYWCLRIGKHGIAQLRKIDGLGFRTIGAISDGFFDNPTPGWVPSWLRRDLRELRGIRLYVSLDAALDAAEWLRVRGFACWPHPVRVLRQIPVTRDAEGRWRAGTPELLLLSGHENPPSAILTGEWGMLHERGRREREAK